MTRQVKTTVANGSCSAWTPGTKGVLYKSVLEHVVFAGVFILLPCRAAEVPALVQPREEAVEHLTAGSHMYGDGARLFAVECVKKMRGNGYKLKEDSLDWI